MRKRIGFQGERLRDARTLRGWTATALAERIGVSPGALSHYEYGQSEPRPPVLSRLAEALSVSEHYFLTPPPQIGPSPFLFRTQAAATKRAREASSVLLKWTHEISLFLEDKVELPSPDLPSIPAPDNPELVSQAEIDDAASGARAHWGLGAGPIQNLASLFEAKGVILGLFSFNGEGQDSVSKFEVHRPFVAVNVDAVAYPRARYDLAHELGHVILHRSIPALTASQPALHKLMEQQAHRFAGAFLFPPKRFRDEFYSLSISSLLPLKRRWGVSVQMMMKRAHELELISDSQYQRAFIDFSRRGYRKLEPLDDVAPVEKPEVLRKAFELLAEHAASRADVIEGFALPTRDVEVLCGFDPGYFTSAEAKVLPLRLRDRAEGGAANQGEVIPFYKK
jgi:Zn-dependent peptidase ImmA (M78 family)/transcriptional regulator with XRE-family HTH domain